MQITIQTNLRLYWAFVVLELLIVFSRLWIRLRVVGARFDATDALILMALTFAVTGASFNTWGMLQHDRVFSYMDPDNFILLFQNIDYVQNFLKVSYGMSFFYFSTLYAVKGAFLGLYFRLFKSLKQSLIVLLWIVTAYVVIAYLVTIGQLLFTCWPIQRNWVADRQYCSAPTQNSAFITQTVLNVSSDILLLVLPIRILYSLQLPGNEIVAVVFIFSIGSVAVAASIARFAAMWKLSNADLSSLDARDVTLGMLFWSGLELGLCIIAVCLPAFRAWWKWAAEKSRKQSAFSSFYNSANKTRGAVSGSGSRRGDESVVKSHDERSGSPHSEFARSPRHGGKMSISVGYSIQQSDGSQVGLNRYNNQGYEMSQTVYSHSHV